MKVTPETGLLVIIPVDAFLDILMGLWFNFDVKPINQAQNGLAPVPNPEAFLDFGRILPFVPVR